MATWPTCGQSGYITPAVLGVPNAQHGDNHEKWLLTGGQSGYINPAVLGVPNAGAHNNEKWLLGPHVGKVATSPLPSWGSPTLNAGTTMRNGYLADMWAKWLHHPCRLGGPQRKEMATWPTCGQSGYITPAVLGVPNAQRGDNNEKWLLGPHVGKVATSPLLATGYLAHMWAKWLHHPCRLGGPQRSTWPTGTTMRNGYLAHMWAKWLHHPCRLGVPNVYITPGGSPTLNAGTTMGYLAHMWATPSWGSPTHAGTTMRNGYLAHMWAKWLHHPCRLGGPQRSTRGQQ